MTQRHVSRPVFKGIMLSLLSLAKIYIKYHRFRLPEHEEGIAKCLLLYLRFSAATYLVLRKSPPEVFTDFVIGSGRLTGNLTFSLESIQPKLKYPPFLVPPGNEMTLTFSEGGRATYYLNGTDVTARFEDF